MPSAPPPTGGSCAVESGSCPERSSSTRATATPPRGWSGPGVPASTRLPRACTTCSVRALSTRGDHGRCCSTSGRPSTSTTTWTTCSTWPSSAASVGVERFVLDDGWFRRRRDDSGWPGRLGTSTRRSGPTACTRWSTACNELGMEFGLWFEPEMVNLDSNLAERHPEWLLQTEHGPGIPSRHQHVLDLAHPDAYAHVLERISDPGRRVPHRLPQVGPQPPARGRRALAERHPRGPRPDRAALPADGRAQGPAPRAGDRVLRRRRRPAGPGHHGARRPGVGLGLHRRPRAPAHGRAGPA